MHLCNVEPVRKEHAMLHHAIMGLAAAALVSATVIPDEALAAHRATGRHGAAAVTDGAAAGARSHHAYHRSSNDLYEFKGECSRGADGMLVCPRWPY
jgi:hypothetical protein